jgi:hypothetical protein
MPQPQLNKPRLRGTLYKKPLFVTSGSCATRRDRQLTVRARSQILIAVFVKVLFRNVRRLLSFSTGLFVSYPYFLQSIHLPVFVFIPMSLVSFSSIFSIFSSFVWSIKGFYTYFGDGWIPFLVSMIETHLRSHWSASGSTLCSEVP